MEGFGSAMEHPRRSTACVLSGQSELQHLSKIININLSASGRTYPYPAVGFFPASIPFRPQPRNFLHLPSFTPNDAGLTSSGEIHLESREMNVKTTDSYPDIGSQSVRITSGDKQVNKPLNFSHRTKQTESASVEEKEMKQAKQKDAVNIARPSKFSVRDILHPNFGSKSGKNDVELDVHSCRSPDSAGGCTTTAVSPDSRDNRVTSPPQSRRGSATSSTSTTSSSSVDDCEEIEERREKPAGKEGANKRPQEAPASGVPAWVFCTRYSDRPCAGPRSRKLPGVHKKSTSDDKRPRTAFSTSQLSRLREEFRKNKYLGEERRTNLAKDLNLTESQVKIWFQNCRAKLKKTEGERGNLAAKLREEGLYNHTSEG